MFPHKRSNSRAQQMINAIDTTPELNASQIRAVAKALDIDPHDLRGVYAALRTTGARTEAAREDLRKALTYRHAMIEHRSVGRHAGKRVTYPMRGVEAWRYDLRAAALKRLRAKQISHVRDALISSYGSCNYTIAKEHTTKIAIVLRGECVDVSNTVEKVWPSELGYGSAYKWRMTVSEHTLCVRADWRESVYDRGLAVVDGMLTLDVQPFSFAGPCNAEIYSATWVRQGRGSSLVVEHGYIVRVRNVAVHASTAKHMTIMRAISVANERADLIAEADQREAESLAARDARRSDLLASLPTDLVITFDDARVAGLCEAGIQDWLAKRVSAANGVLMPEIERALSTGLRARTALSLAYSSGDRVDLVERAALRAAQRAIVPVTKS